MAKVYKVTHYIVDIDGEYDVESITDVLERGLDGIVTLATSQESDEFEWTDDIDLNNVDATIEQHEAYLNIRR